MLYGKDEESDGFSIGQILLLPKPLLERRVLSDERIELYGCGRDDIKSGQIDRRVLATLEYLAESGLKPHQIISLLELGGPTMAMGDHADHIHVGFRPLFGANKKLGRQALAVLKPGQWSNLLDRLRQIENPVVPTTPFKYAIPVPKKKRASSAHQGE